MPAYKDNNTNTWYCQFYYTDWQGISRKKKKRGFRTKREATLWENEFCNTNASDMNMNMASFVDVYFNDKQNELKERSITNKRYMIESHILPYFSNMKVNEITPADIIKWQGIIISKSYSQTYLRMIQNQMTALFTHAQKIYGLYNNPCQKVKKMGKPDADELEFWTIDEYNKFISSVESDDRYYIMFEILYWTGIREGELLALTSSDIDLNCNKISISKTYYRSKGSDIISSPKTAQSVRSIDIPQFLSEEIKRYLSRLYSWPNDARIFPVTAEALQHKMKRNMIKSEVKKIRVHDLRHSHVAYLINQGIEPILIKQRLGHKDIGITLNTYGHLYPDKQKEIADLLDKNRKK